MKLLHFADAHIDMANYGRHDPESGLPLRVLDFLRSLDEIVEAAIRERVDLVIFAGDAYRDRAPAPTYQREWGRRIMRLSRAGIRTLLLVGNHDLSPAVGRANAVQEFETLEIPHVTVLEQPALLGPEQLGLPLQLIALPWISRAGLTAAREGETTDRGELLEEMEKLVTELVTGWLEALDPALPAILTAHASVQGAHYGSERTVMLGADLVLPGSLVRDPRLDYVALGHIHKPQDLNENGHPPVIYPGSIERVDFGEAADRKYYILAEVERGRTRVEWRELTSLRPFLDRQVVLTSPDGVAEALQAALGPVEALAGAIVRLSVEYEREWEKLIDEPVLRRHAAEAFEFHLVRRPRLTPRVRLSSEAGLASLGPLELLEKYWLASGEQDAQALGELAREILEEH